MTRPPTGRPRTQSPVCEVPGCDRPPNARNLCKTHYNRWLKHGDPLANAKPVIQPCKIDGCDDPSKGRGWCSKHYERWRRHGDPEHVDLKSLTPAKPKAKPTPAPARCKTRGCNGEPIARRLCNKHYKQWRKRFKPKPRPKPEPLPEKPPVDVPDHLAKYLERRRKRQEGARGLGRTITQQRHPSGTTGAQGRPRGPESDMREARTA